MKRSTTSLLALFLCLATLLLVSTEVAPVFSQENPDPESTVEGAAEGNQLSFDTWRFVSVAKGTTDARDFETVADKVSDSLTALEEITNARKVYSQMSFPEVALAVEKNRMSGDAARALGEGRRGLIRESLVAAAESLPPDLRVGALDSGNKDSGAASDIDQTIFVWNAETGDLATPDQIDDYIRSFEADFLARNNFSVEHAGIESINGAGFFPDWRLAKDQASFGAEARRVVIEKRGNAELYRSEGQLKSQAEGRGYRALQEFGSRLERLDQDVAKANAKVEQLKSAGADATQIALAETAAKDAKARYDDSTKLSPWTEVVRGADGSLEAVTDKDPRGKVLSVEPEMAERFSFDGSYDNWFMYEHHPSNRPKYLLRSVAEGAGLRSRLLRGNYNAVYDLSDDRRIVAFDYDTEYYSGNTELTDQFVRDIYGRFDGKDGRMKTADAKKALDTAARFRLRHKQKLKPDGKPYTQADVWALYMPDPDPNTPEATRIEIAKARWELDARELMIDNLMSTVQDPSQIVDGPFNAEEFRRIVERVRQQDPRATPRPEDLRYAAELQLFHGFRDLMSPDEMKALAAWDGEEITRPKLTGLVGRMIADGERVGGEKRRRVLERIAREAAVERIITDIPPTVLDQAQAAVEVLRGRMQSARATYNDVLSNYQQGVYTPDYVARSLAEDASKRVATSAGEYLGAVGLVGEIRYLHPNADGRIPAFEVEWGKPRFSSQRLLTNMMSTGNVDAVLQIYDTYLEKGTAAAAARAAQELVMQLPRAGELVAAQKLLIEGDPEPAIQAGTVMLVPGAGQAYALISIATTSVRIAGKLILDPLRDDKLDAIYQGYLPAESAGLITPGRRETARSQLSSLLAPVRVRVIPHTPEDENGQPMRDDNGELVTVWVTGPYTDKEAWQLEFVDSIESQEDAKASYALGGGPEWDELIKRANDPVRYPELHFSARRASLFYHYEQRVDAFIRDLKLADVVDLETLIALRGMSKAQTDLLPFFKAVVADWVFDREEFLPFDSGGYNQVVFDTLAAADQLEKRQQNYTKLGARLLGDFLRSYQILRAADASIESGVRRDVEKTLAAKARFRAHALKVAMEEAHEAALKPELANAIHEEILERRQRPGYSRIKVRPVVVDAASRAGTSADTEGDAVDVLVSVTASPEEHPRPWKIEPPEYVVTPGDSDADLAVRVTVRDANGEIIGKQTTVEVGTLAADGGADKNPQLAGRNLKVCAFRDDMPNDQLAHESAEYCHESDGSALTIWDRIGVFFTPARDFRDPTDVDNMFVWRILNPNGKEVAYGEYFDLGENSTVSSVRLPADKPGAFAARLPARSSDDKADPAAAKIGPGVYKLQTADAKISASTGALFGTLASSIVPDGEWVEEGSFELADATLHFQGFVTENVVSRPLPTGEGIRSGSWTVQSSSDGNNVTVDMSAAWYLSEGHLGRPDPRRHEARSTLAFSVPEVMTLSADTMGRFDVSLASQATGPGAAGSDYFFTAGMNLPVPTNQVPPGRFLLEDVAPLAGTRGVDRLFDFSETKVSGVPTWFRDQRARLSYESAHHAINLEGSGTLARANPWAMSGVPARWLTGHLRDPDTVFVLPVYVHLTDSLDPQTAKYTATTYGYALYGAAAGQYTGPKPADQPSAGEGGGADSSGRDTQGAGGSGDGAGLTGAAALASADARRPHIQDWLSKAQPVENAQPGYQLTFDQWGRVQGKAPNGTITLSGKPDDAGADATEYVWAKAETLDSLNLCTLRAYVESKLMGGDLARCNRSGVAGSVTLDNYVGIAVAEARAQLEAAGLSPSISIVAEAASAAEAFTVVSQEPPVGTSAKPGAEVTLNITGAFSGASQSKVPSLIRQSAAEAQKRIEAAGLVAEVVMAGPAKYPYDEYMVDDQSPGGGSLVAPGTTVRMTIFGEYHPEVPKVVGLAEADARKRLTDLGLEVNTKVDGKPRSLSDGNRVRAASPSAGTRVPAGSAVTLTLYEEFIDSRCEDLLALGDKQRAEGDRSSAWNTMTRARGMSCPGAAAARDAIDSEMDRCDLLIRQSNQQVSAGDARAALARVREAKASRCQNAGIDTGITSLEQQIAREEAAARCDRTVQRGLNQRAAGDQKGALATFRRAQAEGCKNPGLSNTIAALDEALRPPPQPVPPPIPSPANNWDAPITNIGEICSNSCGSWKFYRRIYGGGGYSYPGTREISCNRGNYWHIFDKEIRKYSCESGYENCQYTESYPIKSKGFNDSGTYSVTYGEKGDRWMTFASKAGAQCISPRAGTSSPATPSPRTGSGGAGQSASDTATLLPGTFNRNTPRLFSCEMGIAAFTDREGVLSVGNGRVSDYRFEPDRAVRGYSCDFSYNGGSYSVIVHFVANEGRDYKKRIAEYCRTDASQRHGSNRAINIYSNQYGWVGENENQLAEKFGAAAAKQMMRFHAQQAAPYAMPCP